MPNPSTKTRRAAARYEEARTSIIPARTAKNQYLADLPDQLNIPITLCPNCENSENYLYSEASPQVGGTYQIFRCVDCDAQTAESLKTGGRR